MIYRRTIALEIAADDPNALSEWDVATIASEIAAGNASGVILADTGVRPYMEEPPDMISKDEAP